MSKTLLCMVAGDLHMEEVSEYLFLIAKGWKKMEHCVILGAEKVTTELALFAGKVIAHLGSQIGDSLVRNLKHMVEGQDM